MVESASTVVLMCGLPGAGKTPYAQALVRRGDVRLSIDEAVWQRLGQRDAALVPVEAAFDAPKEEVRREQRQEPVGLMLARRDVVVDYSFWSRAAREDFKALVERHGCRWEPVHLKADGATLRRRLAALHREVGAGAVTVDKRPLERHLSAFEQPDGEGEPVLPQHGPVLRPTEAGARGCRRRVRRQPESLRVRSAAGRPGRSPRPGPTA
ncbi:AAA family ATPase [Kitasatospora sp. DSM 101779]|uniref:AAA family ATPase n=1 Tax=Kitasatospora sp. DSM 101779 TaxID=2853165 RepID=UPI0021D82037|nr:ATP-binding protein [Kitasatospora sp. DSM 101779]MCU7820452.1 ATP-binding protein [Kitasatospora sp. DSM 101779]